MKDKLMIIKIQIINRDFNSQVIKKIIKVSGFELYILIDRSKLLKIVEIKWNQFVKKRRLRYYYFESKSKVELSK